MTDLSALLGNAGAALTRFMIIPFLLVGIFSAIGIGFQRWLVDIGYVQPRPKLLIGMALIGAYVYVIWFYQNSSTWIWLLFLLLWVTLGANRYDLDMAMSKGRWWWEKSASSPPPEYAGPQRRARPDKPVDVVAKLRWYTEAEGGRATLPASETYNAALRFEGETNLWNVLLLLSPKAPDAAGIQKILIRFQDGEQVLDQLAPGERFIVTEGGDGTVAEGWVVVAKNQPGVAWPV